VREPENARKDHASGRPSIRRGQAIGEAAGARVGRCVGRDRIMQGEDLLRGVPNSIARDAIS
jgi:hypothetical protein